LEWNGWGSGERFVGEEIGEENMGNGSTELARR